MTKGRETGANLRQKVSVNPARNYPLAVFKLRNNPPPRIYYQGMAPGLPFSVVCPDLGRGNDVTGVFDGSRGKQRQPVINTCGHGKRGWYHKNFCTLIRQGTVQLWKPQVVTDG